MTSKIAKILAWLGLVGAMVLLARWDAGFEVFPVFGEGLRISPGLAIVPLLGIVFGPVKGVAGALAGGYLAQMLVPEVAFAGTWTFGAAALTALICGLLVKRNWLGAMMVGLVVAGSWLWLSQDLIAGVFTLVFVVNLLVVILLAGVFGTDFLGGPSPLYRLLGYLLVVWAGLSGGILALSAFSATVYQLPEYMWNGVGLYQFLRFLYQFAALSLILVWLGKMVLPSFITLAGGRLALRKDHPLRKVGAGKTGVKTRKSLKNKEESQK